MHRFLIGCLFMREVFKLVYLYDICSCSFTSPAASPLHLPLKRVSSLVSTDLLSRTHLHHSRLSSPPAPYSLRWKLVCPTPFFFVAILTFSQKFKLLSS